MKRLSPTYRPFLARGVLAWGGFVVIGAVLWGLTVLSTDGEWRGTLTAALAGLGALALATIWAFFWTYDEVGKPNNGPIWPRDPQDVWDILRQSECWVASGHLLLRDNALALARAVRARLKESGPNDEILELCDRIERTP